MKMNSTNLVRAVFLGLLCLLTSCSEDNESPKCDNDIALAGVKGALYSDIAQEGDQRRFFNSLDFKDIETVKITEEGRICSARLTILKKYYLPINYEIAVDDDEYYVTFSGINEGSKENIYRIVNGMRPNLTGDQ
jgi:hypothetical protein